jgi:hypothetical protein
VLADSEVAKTLKLMTRPGSTKLTPEGKSGNGWVILCGVHPEAPQSWRSGMTFTTSVSVDNAYAKTLVTAALSGTSLPHF